MADQVQVLDEFVEKAVRNYKYTNETGTTLRRALNLFGEVLQTDERESVELIKKRADDIANRVDIKSPNKYSASSLMVYKSRVMRVINDYLQYGTDAKKMANWSPKAAKKVAKPEKPTTPQSSRYNGDFIEGEEVGPVPISTPVLINASSSRFDAKGQTLDLPLQDDRGVIIYYPADLKVGEAEKIGNVLKSIAQLNEA